MVGIKKGFMIFSFCILSLPCDAAALLLFGGNEHDIFLGCLNCNQFDAGSICNQYGNNGSRYSNDSIWNPYSDYGSRYSDHSPWNKYAINAPVIVDKEGNFYGYFTANKYANQRTTIKLLVALTDNVDWVVEDLQRARDIFCGK